MAADDGIWLGDKDGYLNFLTYKLKLQKRVRSIYILLYHSIFKRNLQNLNNEQENILCFIKGT